MRLNAPISAFLALAVLLPGPTSVAAATRPTHRVAAHHKKTANDDRSVRPQHSTGKNARKRSAVDTRVPVALERAPSHTPKRRSATLRAATSPREIEPKAASLMTPEHRKATSQDFLAAAGASDLAISTVSSTGAATADADAVRPTQAMARTRSSTHNARLDDVVAEATTPIILPTLYNKRGRLIVPKPLKGSHEILVRQNRVADRDGLDRIEDDNDLVRMRVQQLLVALPINKALDVDDRLPSDRRYCRPWTAQFLAALSRAHYARFHTPLQVNSAVRTVEFQQRLQRTNGNAAPAEGETASPHLTGQAVDIAKHGLSLTEIAWLRGYLLPLIQEGRIDVEEEFQQSCFHISVYKKYMPSTPAPRQDVATSHHSSTATLATAIR